MRASCPIHRFVHGPVHPPYLPLRTIACRRYLCEAFVRGFRHAPDLAFGDLIILARFFDEEAELNSLNTKGVVDPLGVDQLQLRVSFFLQVIGGSLDDLVQVPHMLTCDLAKVPMLRHAYCLSYGLSVPPVKLLTKGDVTFCEEVEGCDLESLNEFEREGKHLSFFQGAQV